MVVQNNHCKCKSFTSRCKQIEIGKRGADRFGHSFLHEVGGWKPGIAQILRRAHQLLKTVSDTAPLQSKLKSEVML